MKPNEKDALRNLLGPEFSDEEISEILKEDPSLASSAESLSQLLERARQDPILPLSPDFTARTMEKLHAPGFWEKWVTPLLNLRVLASATAGIALLAGGLYIAPRFFPPSPGPGLALREVVGPHQEKIFYVRFALKNPGARSVSVSGDFNQWEETALQKSGGEDGVFTLELPLKEGTYTYAFLVDGKKWVADPSAPRSIEDGFGNKNSVINL
ncbi:MAG: hypothetical protein U1F57_03560 [bacterium]